MRARSKVDGFAAYPNTIRKFFHTKLGTGQVDPHAVVLVKEFLLTEQRCPPDWRPLDLYLFRDDAVVFYVGQSYVAFDRVWRHILDGYKGRS
ncbi:MAG TPA: hypothetical protein VL334_06360, partial [Anaerolineae bacterium]|nr:hypothetical protein [Anaerolineae bacterium]